MYNGLEFVSDETKPHIHYHSETDFDLFYSNLTSLSSHAKEYLFSLPSNIKTLLCVETHESDNDKLIRNFRSFGFKAYPNKPCKSDNGSLRGTHGGEVVAVRSHISASPVEPEILNQLVSHFGGHLRFASSIIRFKGMSLLIVTVYLWCSEGLTERNNMILHQIKMLQQILDNIPMLIVGDFNMTGQQFLESGWPTKL